MKISIKNKRLLLEEVFNQIELVTPDGEVMLIQMRDGKFEVGLQDKSVKSETGLRYFNWFSVGSEGIKELYPPKTASVKDEENVAKNGVSGG